MDPDPDSASSHPGGAEPLGPEDVAILGLESPTVAGHTCKVIWVDAPQLDNAALTELVGSRVLAVPRLTRRLGEHEGALAWVPYPEFDPAEHVVEVETAAPADPAALRRIVSELFERRLDRDRPLWRMDTVRLEDGALAVIWRLHHALADGTTAMRFARELLWDEAEPPAGPRTGSAAGRDLDRTDQRRRRDHLTSFFRRELSRSRERSPFDGRIGGRREVAFAEIELSELHDAAKAACGATLNDAVLSLVAGALKRWLEHRHGALGELRVKVPVSLHRPGDEGGNRDSFFAVRLPLDEPDPVRRLELIHAETAVRKRDGDAERMDELLDRLARVSPRLRRFSDRVVTDPRRFALNVSNVPGPRAPVSVLGNPVTALHSFAEIGEHHALRVAVISMADTLCFGFCADPGLVPGVELMARGIGAEAEALTAAP